MEETVEKLINLTNDIEYEIERSNNTIKMCKKDIKRLIKTKDDIIETGIDDYVFDDNIARITGIKESNEKRIYVLKKIKYRLDVAKRMMNELN